MAWERKVDRNYYDTAEYKGEKQYTLTKVENGISAYATKDLYQTVIFESETDEKIGIIYESDVRTSWKRYYTAIYCNGWDGKKATKKQYWKTLCTRGDYDTALHLILAEYKNR